MLLDRGQVFVSPFDLNVEYRRSRKTVEANDPLCHPVYDRQAAKRGILILNYLGAGLIEKLTELSPANRREVWLLNREGFYLSGPNPDDEWGFMFGHDRHVRVAIPRRVAAPRLRREQPDFRTQHGLFTVRGVVAEGSDAPGEHGNTSSRDAQLIVVRTQHRKYWKFERRDYSVACCCSSPFCSSSFFFVTWYLAYIAALPKSTSRNLRPRQLRLRDLSARLFTAQEDERLESYAICTMNWANW